MQSKTRGEPFLSRLIKRRIGILPLVLVVIFFTSLIAILDFLTPDELNVSIFYLAPIAMAAFFGGSGLGYPTALLCASVWIVVLVVGGQGFSSPFFYGWNLLVRVGYYALFVYLVCALRRHIEDLRQLGLRDPLTKAANRRYFEEYLSLTVARAARAGAPLTFMLFDIDDFKHINDEFGHLRGDEVLTILADCIQARIRPDDMLARLGGDEFALILYAMDYDRSEEVTARLIDSVAREFAARGIVATMSVGMITYAVPCDRPEVIIRQADELMYEVKRGGKNGRKHSLVAGC